MAINTNDITKRRTQENNKNQLMIKLRMMIAIINIINGKHYNKKTHK